MFESFGVCGSHETVVSDFDESFGKDMEEEPSDKLGRLEGESFAVLSGETDSVVVHTDEPSIGDTDPVGISAEVVKDLLGPTEGRLTINVPRFAVERIFESSESVRVGELVRDVGQVEFALTVGRLQEVQKLSAERRDMAWMGNRKLSLVGTHSLFDWLSPPPVTIQ